MSKNRRKNNARNHARKTWLPVLLRRQNHLCLYCREPIVRLSEILPTAVEVQTAWVVWEEAGDLLSSRIATVDHVTRLADGGSNHHSNLVAACYSCNHARDQVLAKAAKKEDHARRAARGMVKRKRRTSARTRWILPVDERELGEAGA